MEAEAQDPDMAAAADDLERYVDEAGTPGAQGARSKSVTNESDLMELDPGPESRQGSGKVCALPSPSLQYAATLSRLNSDFSAHMLVSAASTPSEDKRIFVCHL